MTATGQDIVKLALEHRGEDYVLGAVTPLNNPDHKGPWDCSLYASWCLYQVSEIIYGCTGTHPDNPALADPYTGAWARDAEKKGHIIEVNDAARTAGAFVLKTGQRIGHIAICQGDGRTVEAMGSAYGVCEDVVGGGRRWDYGILVPGIQYYLGPYQPIHIPDRVYRVMTPMMQGDEILEIQRALLRAGFNPKDLDGIYGYQTCNAVIQFQRAKGLVADGEVGPQTIRALGVM